MRARTLITATFAVSLAIAGFATLNTMAKKTDVEVPKEQVLGTSVELSAGTLLRAQDTTWTPVATVDADEIARPQAREIQGKPDIVETTAASVYGAVLRHSLAGGTPIRRGDIVKPGDRDFLQVVLTPGDHVDVILTQNFKNDQSSDETRNAPLTRRSVGETVVQNLRVLAIDTLDVKTNGASTNPANGNF